VIFSRVSHLKPLSNPRDVTLTTRKRAEEWLAEQLVKMVTSNDEESSEVEDGTPPEEDKLED
jgi:hypothetical protein